MAWVRRRARGGKKAVVWMFDDLGLGQSFKSSAFEKEARPRGSAMDIANIELCLSI
jgi:hypothetical protein